MIRIGKYVALLGCNVCTAQLMLETGITGVACIGGMQVAVLELVLEVHACIFPEKAHFVPNLLYHKTMSMSDCIRTNKLCDVHHANLRHLSRLVWSAVLVTSTIKSTPGCLSLRSTICSSRGVYFGLVTAGMAFECASGLLPAPITSFC